MSEDCWSTCAAQAWKAARCEEKRGLAGLAQGHLAVGGIFLIGGRVTRSVGKWEHHRGVSVRAGHGQACPGSAAGWPEAPAPELFAAPETVFPKHCNFALGVNHLARRSRFGLGLTRAIAGSTGGLGQIGSLDPPPFETSMPRVSVLRIQRLLDSPGSAIPRSASIFVRAVDACSNNG